jgi:hypothetical protein
MRNIITIEDIKRYRPLTNNVAGGRIEPFITETQELDLRNLLGAELYDKVVEDISPLNYPELDELIVPVLAYRTYARLITHNRVTVTSNGVVNKTVEGSVQASTADVHAQVGLAKEAAVNYEERLVKFLNDNAKDYPEWKCGGSKTTGSIRISAAGDKVDYRDAVADEVNRQSGAGLWRGKR